MANIKNKKILITGGAGFIGSQIVEDLLKEGAKVRIYDNFSTGNMDNLKKVIADVEVIKGDILDFESLSKAMKGVEIVSHHAAQLEVAKAVIDPYFDLKINTIGSLNVFKAAQENGIEKIINASSAAVYGQAKYIPQDESHPMEPNWPYGVSKLATEKYAAIFKELCSIPIISLRYAIVYGPREWYRRALTVFLKRAIEGKPLVIFGDGNQIRDFVFVQDLVAFHNLCLRDDKLTLESFNVSSGIGTNINELAQAIIKVTGKEDSQIIHEDVVPGAKSKHFDRVRLPLELDRLVLSYAKAQKMTGWMPKVDLEQGLRLEYEWISQNGNRWGISS